MPFIESNKCKLKIYYEIYYGENKPDTVVLVHPIGGNIEIWNNEIALILKEKPKSDSIWNGHTRSNNRNTNSSLQ